MTRPCVASAAVIAATLVGCASDRSSRPRPPVQLDDTAPPLVERAADGDRREDEVPVGLEEPTEVLIESPTSSDEASAQATSSIDPALAWVGGRPVLASQLLGSWLQRDAVGARSALNVLISGQLAQLEATRLGLRIDRPLVAEATSEHLDQLRRKLVGDEGTAGDLEEFIRTRFDLDPGRYRERLEADTIRELVTERVVRAWTLSNEYARVRLLLLEDGSQVGTIQAEIARGVPFADLAERLSIDRSGEDGGLVPFLVRNERAPLSRLAFDTPVGEVGGPLELAEAVVLMLVEDRPAPLVGDWPEVGVRVEDSLLDDPVTDDEWLVWQLAMDRRYGIDVRPFYEFVDEPFR